MFYNNDMDLKPLIYQAKLRNVIDGDTIDLQVNLGLGFIANARIRLIGIDAPEIFGVGKNTEEFKQGQIAKLAVKEWFFNANEVLRLIAEHRDLYGRWLGEIFKNGNDVSLNMYLKRLFYKSEYWTWVHQEPLLEKW